jgi:hypothetical protein
LYVSVDDDDRFKMHSDEEYEEYCQELVDRYDPMFKELMIPDTLREVVETSRRRNIAGLSE